MASSGQPKVIMLGGCNGAGKSTAARSVLAETLRLVTFVNADVIAQGLAGFLPDDAAIEASRIMLTRLRALASERANFAFETTLAGRSYGLWLKELRTIGYHVSLHYFWVENVEIAISRVELRRRAGGHAIPVDTIRRRYSRSVRNFHATYRWLCDEWFVYDNSWSHPPRLLARALAGHSPEINDVEGWQKFAGEQSNE